MSEINREDWYKALEESGVLQAWNQARREVLLNNDPNAVSMDQLQKMWNCAGSTAREQLRRLKQAGRIKETSKAIEDSAGRVQRVKAYILLDKPT